MIMSDVDGDVLHINVRTANKKPFLNSIKFNEAGGYSPKLIRIVRGKGCGYIDEYMVVRCGTTGNRSRMVRITGRVGCKIQVSR